MDEMDQVSSTTKESVGEDKGVSTTVETIMGDTDEHDLSLNSKKRKSMVSDEEEGSHASGPVPVATKMDVQVDGNEVESSAQEEHSPTSSSTSNVVDTEVEPEPEVELRVTYNKEPIPVKISLNKTVGDLKRLIEGVTRIAPELQKVLLKGIAKDDAVLKSLGVGPGSKVMVIGTKLDDVLAVNKTPTAAELKGDESSTSSSSAGNWCSVPSHQKIIDKGIPEDVMPGILDCNDPLPDFPISGMLSSKGSKLRLTFKLEADELWIGTKERTEKVSIGSIRNVVSQPIPGWEHYHILALQLGPTEASRLFIYWFPAQYVRALKEALGG